MARARSIRTIGSYPRAPSKKRHNPFRFTIAALDESYRHFKPGHKPDALFKKIAAMRRLGYELPDDLLRRRYPNLFGDVGSESVAASAPLQPATEASLPVPTPAEKVSVSAQPARPGQADFRKQILSLYGRCAVTGCKTETVLDAAHIIPFVDERSHIAANGICLRTDIHRLFDAGYLSIGGDYKVKIAKCLLGTDYESLVGSAIWTPQNEAHKPDARLLVIRGKYL